MLAEISAKEISQTEHPEGFEENREVTRAGGAIAGDAREAIEKQTGRPVITNKNAAQLNHLVTTMLETSAKEAMENAAPSQAEQKTSGEDK